MFRPGHGRQNLKTAQPQLHTHKAILLYSASQNQSQEGDKAQVYSIVFDLFSPLPFSKFYILYPIV